MTALGKGRMINSVNESLGQYVRSIYYKEPIAKNWEISFLHKKRNYTRNQSWEHFKNTIGQKKLLCL